MRRLHNPRIRLDLMACLIMGKVLNGEPSHPLLRRIDIDTENMTIQVRWLSSWFYFVTSLTLIGQPGKVE